ncbi:MAG: cytochrome c biogenesis factor, partial [Microcoleus sp. SIO2G3]|nr:cytochrome c biogenesis factor [Microcoleus sp. SIO2G3]
QAARLGETALTLDIQYADPEFQRQNLWGDRLVTATQQFLETPQMRATIARLSGSNTSATSTEAPPQ